MHKNKEHVRTARADPRARVHPRFIARLAIRALYMELALYPKPGLVSFRDAGAHTDMNAVTFMRSLFALRHYFAHIALAGAQGQPFILLKQLGIAAENRMLYATRGVNTHRGAVFVLGLLAAAAGAVGASGASPSDAALRHAVVRRWARALRIVPASVAAKPSHGQIVATRFGVAGARGEVIEGYPAVFDIALPALRAALARGADNQRAMLHAFFSLLARVNDTNVLYRGGRPGLDFMREQAQAFLATGSVFKSGWHERSEALHRACVERGLSPGGCADLLSATWFVHSLQASRR